MMRRKKTSSLLLIALLVGLQGCAIFGGNPSNQLTGQWQSNVGGFSIVVEYNQEMVKVDDSEPIAYQLEGDTLTFLGVEQLVRQVSFPSEGKMIQTDPLTGSRQEFTRVAK